MNRFEIWRHSDDFLTSQRWIFWLHETDLILDEYHMFKKETKRHKPKCMDNYKRIMRRDSSLKIDNVPLPEDVKTEALEMVKSKIQIKLDIR